METQEKSKAAVKNYGAVGGQGWQKLSPEFIRGLLQRVNIVDVVSSVVDIKKQGANYVGVCPFKEEKSGSFTVSEGKQFYHCFGCGANGDAIKFLVETKGMSFFEAVTSLAGSVGMELPKNENPSAQQEERINPVLFQKMESATRYYQHMLLEDPNAIAYLLGRGIRPITAVRFRIGLAPKGWQNLTEVFGGYEEQELGICGLVVKSEKDRYYDRFRDRLMFPISNAKGEVIAFGGRVFDDSKPKYLNSPESPLFDKGKEVFGLVQAAKSIREKGFVIVVEGYMDTVALSEAGVRNVVGTMGTATTGSNVQRLFRSCDKVVFCFDGDRAGIDAAWRALENTIPYLTDSKRACFIFLPEGMDPDDFIRKHGRTEFELLCKKATPLSDYLIKTMIKRHEPESAEGKAKLILDVKPLVQKFNLQQAKLVRMLMLKQISSVTEFSVSELEEIFGIAQP